MGAHEYKLISAKHVGALHLYFNSALEQTDSKSPLYKTAADFSMIWFEV